MTVLPDGLLSSKVEHQRTKLKVASSSPAKVHFFSYPKKKKKKKMLLALDLGFEVTP